MREREAETAREKMTAGMTGRAAPTTLLEKRKRWRERVARPREYNKIIVSALL